MNLNTNPFGTGEQIGIQPPPTQTNPIVPGEKELPQVEVLVYPSDGLPREVVRAFSGHDEIAKLLLPGAGAGASIDLSGALGATESSAVTRWAGQSNFELLSNDLRVVRLDAAGLAEGIGIAAGKDKKQPVVALALRPRVLWFNCRTRDFDPSRHPEGTAPQGRGLARQFEPLVLTPLRGVPRARFGDGGATVIPHRATDVGPSRAAGDLPTCWDTVLDNSSPARTRVFHACQTPDDSVAIQVDRWDADTGFALEFTDLQVAAGQTQTNQARMRIEFGGVWSIVVRQGASVTFEKRQIRPLKDASGRVVNLAQWESRGEFNQALKPSFEAGSQLVISGERIGGGFLMTLSDGQNEATLSYIDYQEIPLPGRKVNRVPQQMRWQAAPLKFSFLGLSAHLGIGRICCCDAQGEPLEAPGRRLAPAPGRGMEAPARVLPRGWIENGTQIRIENVATKPIPVGRGLSSRGVSYDFVLVADKAGLESPLLTDVLYAIEGQSSFDGRLPLDVTPAVIGRISVQTGQPPEVPSSETRLNLDNALLDGLTLPDDAPAGATWKHYLLKYHRLQANTAWSRQGTGAQEEIEPLDNLFDGWVFTAAGTTEGFMQNTTSVVGRDGIMRERRPWAIIDERFKAGDFLFLERGRLYGAELVQEWLRVLFGDAVAESLNGGLGLLAFFPKRGHYPLLGQGAGRIGAIAGAVPLLGQNSGDGLIFPPRFRQDVVSSIAEIQTLDHAVFYWGFPPGANVTRPVPIYGRVTEIIKAARALGVYEVPDCRESASTPALAAYAADSRLRRAEVRAMPERDFTRVWVLSGKPEGAGAGLMPALMSGSDSIAPGPADDPEDGGERTLIIENDLFLKTGSNQAEIQANMDGIARLILAQFKGVEQAEYSVATRGDAALRWGREIKPLMQADSATGAISAKSLEIHGKRLHVNRADHSIDVQGTSPGDAWETTLSCRPIAATGL